MGKGRGRAAAKGSAGSGGAGAGCGTARTTEAVAGVSRGCGAKAAVCAPESCAAHCVSARSPALLLFFSDHNVGTPQCIIAQELRVECMFPADTEER